MQSPLARTADLTVENLPDETLVFDHRTNKAHCLNRTTVIVWKGCDGRTDLAGLGRLIERELGINGGAVVVQLALEQLASRHLLEETVEHGSPAQRRSRREVLKKLAAVVTLPAILTVAAPRANAAGSNSTAPMQSFNCTGQPDTTTCGTASWCCQGVCLTPKPSGHGCGVGCHCKTGVCRANQCV